MERAYSDNRLEDTLDNFVQRFDQQAALYARQDDEAVGRWHRAFLNVSLFEDVFASSVETEFFYSALRYTLQEDHPASKLLKEWRSDWTRLLKKEGATRDELEDILGPYHNRALLLSLKEQIKS